MASEAMSEFCIGVFWPILILLVYSFMFMLWIMRPPEERNNRVDKAIFIAVILLITICLSGLVILSVLRGGGL